MMASGKVYTKFGDKGQTMLANGAKVPKSSLRIETYGTVDELNAFVGLLGDTVRMSYPSDPTDIMNALNIIQNELFDLGSELATPPEALNPARQKTVDGAAIARLESEMDEYSRDLPPLTNFVLPGGHPVNSYAHICRTICRRAERHLVRLREDEPAVRIETQIYLNRLSDWFFVLSRRFAKDLNFPEVIWNAIRGE